MTVPTLVIGVGMGGIRVVQALAEFVKDKGEQGDYRFIAVDSSKKDLQERIKSGYNIVPVEITEEGFDVEDMISKCQYLYKGAGRKGVGALRDRVYGRFLLDLNMSKVGKAVDASLKDLKDKWKKERGEKKAEILIWLVHTIGGGTGSGTFPSLVVNTNKLAKEILEDADIKYYLFCVGVLPSATNIRNITHANFDKRYLANSYSALKELELLASAEDITLTQFNPYGSNPEIAIEKRPFDRYFLFGIDEDMVGELKDDEAEAVEEYLTSSNKIIANMMYAVPNYPKGLENLWKPVKSPFIAFGESELVVPIEEIKKVATENDRLGDSVDEETKKKLKKERDLVSKTAIRELNEGFVEEKCKTVLSTYKLRGLSYFIGKLQNEFNKRATSAQTDFEDTIEDIWDKLERQEWAEDIIGNSEGLSVGDKYEKIVDMLNERIRDRESTISSWKRPHPILEKRFNVEKKNYDRTLDELSEKKDILEKSKLLKLHIDSNLCKSLREEIGHKNDGVSEVTTHIRKLELELEKMYKKLSEEGWGRVVKLGIQEEKANKLTLIGEGINVANVESVPDFIRVFDIKAVAVEELITNRIKQADDITLRLGIAASEEGGRETPTKELFIICHKDSEPTLGEHEEAFMEWNKERIITETFDCGKYVFVDFRLGLRLEDIKEYRYRKEEYERGELAETTNLNEDIGKIFAYPEWFMDDENVRAVFKKMHEVEGSKSAKMPEKAEKTHIAAPQRTINGRILVDGSNVAWESKKDGKPNIDNIELIRLQLEKEGYNNPITFVDANLRHIIPKIDKERFEGWLNKEKIKQSPAQIKADETILKFADEDEGELKIVSNDTFREREGEYPWLKDPSRRVPFKIVDNRAILHFR